MATKAQVTAAITAQLSGNAGLTTYTEHEEFLHTETDSILESIYPAEITETEAANVILVNNANITYSLKIVKIGRRVNISGFVVNATSNPINTATLFTINGSAASYLPSTTNYGSLLSTVGIGSGQSFLAGTEVSQIFITGNNVYLWSTIFAGEGFTIDITYNTLN